MQLGNGPGYWAYFPISYISSESKTKEPSRHYLGVEFHQAFHCLFSRLVFLKEMMRKPGLALSGPLPEWKPWMNLLSNWKVLEVLYQMYYGFISHILKLCPFGGWWEMTREFISLSFGNSLANWCALKWQMGSRLSWPSFTSWTFSWKGIIVLWMIS